MNYFKLEPVTAIYFVLLMIVSCSSNDNAIVESNTTVLISPKQTDASYPSGDESHYVVRNPTIHRNKLLVFIGGSFSIPKDYSILSDHAASLGFDVINLSYPNKVATAPLGTDADNFVFDNYRDELCFGNPVSNKVDVDQLNSISTRINKLLIFLSINYPNQNWSQYLKSDNTVIWESMVVAGHSQGSGHACYLAKKNRVDRVVMFSGPNDFSSFYNSPANWLFQSGATPATKHFALLHIQDEIVSYNNQVLNLHALGLLPGNENPILIDDLTVPFSNNRTLSIGIPAISFHSSTVGANAKLPPVWTYLFTSL